VKRIPRTSQILCYQSLETLATSTSSKPSSPLPTMRRLRFRGWHSKKSAGQVQGFSQSFSWLRFEVVIHRNSWGGRFENVSEDMMPLGVIVLILGWEGRYRSFGVDSGVPRSFYVELFLRSKYSCWCFACACLCQRCMHVRNHC